MGCLELGVRPMWTCDSLSSLASFSMPTSTRSRFWWRHRQTSMNNWKFPWRKLAGGCCWSCWVYATRWVRQLWPIWPITILGQLHWCWASSQASLIVHLFSWRLARAWTSRTDGERLPLTSPKRLARLFLWQDHLLMGPTQWNRASLILLSVVHFDPADVFAACWHDMKIDVTHHYNRSDHNLYNIIYIYIHIIYDYIYIYYAYMLWICEPTVLCFTKWIR